MPYKNGKLGMFLGKLMRHHYPRNRYANMWMIVSLSKMDINERLIIKQLGCDDRKFQLYVCGVWTTI